MGREEQKFSQRCHREVEDYQPCLICLAESLKVSVAKHFYDLSLVAALFTAMLLCYFIPTSVQTFVMTRSTDIHNALPSMTLACLRWDNSGIVQGGT